MSHSMDSNPLNSLAGLLGHDTPGDDNALWLYLQEQPADALQAIAQDIPPDVLEILSHNIRSLVGNLPPDQFGMQVVTTRENLARLLSGAMMGGYFVRSMEQRLQLETMMAPRQESESPN